MTGTPKIRGAVNAVLNRLVREGVITGFRTNFANKGPTDLPLVTVTVSGEGSLDAARAIVMDALAAVAVGIDLAVERA